MTERAYSEYAGGTDAERASRDLLRHAMEAQGFTANLEEWWHFNYKDWQQYPVLNIRFEDLEQ
jgi:D-alanyl-D-alanine dipeptidase